MLSLRSRSSWPIIFVVFVLIFSLTLYSHQHGVLDQATRPFTHFFPSDHYLPPGMHAIDILISNANVYIDFLGSRNSDAVEIAAKRYRKLRGRHPPPGFDKWFEYAQSKQASVVEDFFDQIYKDIEPFWALHPANVRTMAASWHNVVSIRNGTATPRSKESYNDEWLGIWQGALAEIQEFLPDVDLAFNDFEEPRVIVPNEEITGYLRAAAQTRHTKRPSKKSPIIDQFSTYSPLQGRIPSRRHGWSTNEPYWPLVNAACSPDGPAHNISLDEDLTAPPVFPESPNPSTFFHGYVANWTTARSVCEQPYLRNLHGAFIDPVFKSTTPHLFPVFSGRKITGINNDILVPAASDFSDAQKYIFHDDPGSIGPWHEKIHQAAWRGAASGGSHNKATWTRFQRHRLVSMMNASQVTAAEGLHYTWDPPFPDSVRVAFQQATTLNFPLPNVAAYPLAALQTDPTTLGAWTARLSNAAFTHMLCYPQWDSTFTSGASCEYTDPYYEIAPSVPMAEMLRFKYLPDIDGQTSSGRWRSYLRSSSLPLKSTIFTEWHDARLIPWAHFVPLSADLRDWWGVLEYFAGYDPNVKSYTEDELVQEIGAAEGVAFNAQDAKAGGDMRGHKKTKGEIEALRRNPHDGEAERIAKRGKDWSNRMLRREDMIVYLWRVVLEYARVCDDQREQMGWTGDMGERRWGFF